MELFFTVYSPLKQATFLQQFDSLWVCRECPQEEEVVLAECGEQAITLQAALRLQPRGRGKPWHHVPHQVLQVALTILVTERRCKLENEKHAEGECAFLCVCADFSNLIRFHEELNKLTANHSELSGLWVIQRQPCIQLTTGLIKVQQPPHKPVKHKKVFKTRCHRSIENVAMAMNKSYLCICSSLLFLRFTFGHWERKTTF